MAWTLEGPINKIDHEGAVLVSLDSLTTATDILASRLSSFQMLALFRQGVSVTSTYIESPTTYIPHKKNQAGLQDVFEL